MQIALHGDINADSLRPYNDESRTSYTMTSSEMPNFLTSFFSSINNGDSRQPSPYRYLWQCSFTDFDWGSKKGGFHRCKKSTIILSTWLMPLIRPF